MPCMREGSHIINDNSLCVSLGIRTHACRLCDAWEMGAGVHLDMVHQLSAKAGLSQSCLRDKWVGLIMRLDPLDYHGNIAVALA